MRLPRLSCAFEPISYTVHMMKETKSAVSQEARIQWPDLSKDTRALVLAKVALGWDTMSAVQQMDNAQALAIRAQQIKGAL